MPYCASLSVDRRRWRSVGGSGHMIRRQSPTPFRISKGGVIYELALTGFCNRSNCRANSPCWKRSSAFSSSSSASFFGVRIFSKLAPSMVFLFFVQRLDRALGAVIGTSRARFVFRASRKLVFLVPVRNDSPALDLRRIFAILRKRNI